MEDEELNEEGLPLDETAMAEEEMPAEEEEMELPDAEEVAATDDVAPDDFEVSTAVGLINQIFSSLGVPIKMPNGTTDKQFMFALMMLRDQAKALSESGEEEYEAPEPPEEPEPVNELEDLGTTGEEGEEEESDPFTMSLAKANRELGQAFEQVEKENRKLRLQLSRVRKASRDANQKQAFAKRLSLLVREGKILPREKDAIIRQGAKVGYQLSILRPYEAGKSRLNSNPASLRIQPDTGASLEDQKARVKSAFFGRNN